MKTTFATLAWILSTGLNHLSFIEMKALQEEVKALNTFLHASLEESE